MCFLCTDEIYRPYFTLKTVILVMVTLVSYIIYMYYVLDSLHKLNMGPFLRSKWITNMSVSILNSTTICVAWNFTINVESMRVFCLFRG